MTPAPLAAADEAAAIAGLDHVVIRSPNPERAVASTLAGWGSACASTAASQHGARGCCSSAAAEISSSRWHTTSEPGSAMGRTGSGASPGACPPDVAKAHVQLRAAGVEVSEVRTGRRPAAPGSAKVPLVFGLALPAGLAFVLAPNLHRIAPTRNVLVLIFVTGLLMRAVWFGASAAIEDDYNRYMWDGAVVAHGLDPYRYAPQLFLSGVAIPTEYGAIAETGRSTLERINFANLGSLYPSVAQLAFALAYLIAPFNLDALRAVFLGAEIATFLLLIALLAELKFSPLWSALYSWNPLPVFTLIGVAHVDALVSPFVLGAILMTRRGRPNAAVAMLGASARSEIWPLLLAPLVLMPLIGQPRRLAQVALVFGAFLTLALGPLLLSVLRPSSGLAAYTSSWEVNNAFFAWAIYQVSSGFSATISQRKELLRGVLAVATVGTALFVARRPHQQMHALVRDALIGSATVFYLSPAQFPWYAAWFLRLRHFSAVGRCSSPR